MNFLIDNRTDNQTITETKVNLLYIYIKGFFFIYSLHNHSANW